MNVLKLKAVFYRYTGIYLADKEENDYLSSEEFWKDFERTAKSCNDCGPRNVQGLLIGIWQAKYGFARPMSRIRLFRPLWLWRPVRSLDSFRLAMYWDLQAFFKALFS